MKEPLRVPMPGPASFVGQDELLIHDEPLPQCGTRVSMDGSDEVWRRAGRAAIEHAVQRLAEETVRRHSHEITSAVHGYILNREWAEPIIEQAIKDGVERVIRDMLDAKGAGDG